MSLVFDSKTGQPVHFPADPNHFEFDKEVATIFENMAVRSIPMYQQAHNIHAQIAYDLLIRKLQSLRNAGDKITLLDIGASTGMFYKTLWALMGLDLQDEHPRLRCVAVDMSLDMLNRIREVMPHVQCYEMDAMQIEKIKVQPEIVNMSYTAQFVGNDTDKQMLFDVLYAVMERDSILFMAQKDDYPDLDRRFGEGALLYQSVTELYHKFRRDNGYTQKEIDAKTEALKDSMWPTDYQDLCRLLTKAGFYGMTETTRWLQFSSMFCLKT